MNRRLYFLSVLCVLFVPSLAPAADLEALLTDAVRYANTPEKHAAKVAAREELKQRMPQAFHAAMEYVHGDNVMLQVLVMEWVRQLPADTVVPALLEFVDHERADTRRLAIFFLGFHVVPEATGRVMPYLYDDERCRGAAIRTLGKWRAAEGVPAIRAWLLEGRERIRVVAANALRDIGDPSAIPMLVTALDDPVFTVRNTAARALVSFGEQAADKLDPEHPMHARVLADLGEMDVAEVLPGGAELDQGFFVP